MLEALRRGSVQAMIAEAWRVRRQATATRDQVLVGTNRFVVPVEAGAGRDAPPAGKDAGALRQRLAACERSMRPFADLLAAAADGAILAGPPARASSVRPICRHMLDEDWARLRLRSHAALVATRCAPVRLRCQSWPDRAARRSLGLDAGSSHGRGHRCSAEPTDPRCRMTSRLPLAPAHRPSASSSAGESSICSWSGPLPQRPAAEEPSASISRRRSEVDEAERAKAGVTDAIADGRDLVAWLNALHDALDSPRAAEEEER